MATFFHKRGALGLLLLAVLTGVLLIPVGTAHADARPDALMVSEDHRVSDPITRVEVTKLSYAAGHQPLSGAKFQLIEKSSGTVIYEWTSDGTTIEISRELYYPPNAPHDQDHRVNINLDTPYIIHEVSAPAGYETAPDVEFEITGWYDSSISVYNYGVDSDGLQHAYLDGLYHITILDESKTEDIEPITPESVQQSVNRRAAEEQQAETATASTNPLSTLAQTGDYGYIPPIIAATIGFCILALGIRNQRRTW